MELISLIKKMNKRLERECDRLDIREYIKLKQSGYCEYIVEDDGICIYKLDSKAKIIYVYYLVSFNGINLSRRLLKLSKGYTLVCSVNKLNTSLIKFYSSLGFNIEESLDSTNYSVMVRGTKLDMNGIKLIEDIKDALDRIISSKFVVVFDMDDTLNTMDEYLFKDLGLFDKYKEPRYESISIEDRLLLDKKYLEVGTYNIAFDIDKGKFDTLKSLVGEENIVIYTHCLSLDIAKFKYKKIKDELGGGVSIVFSFDEKKPSLYSNVIFEDSNSNLDDSKALIKYGIKRFYNNNTWELNTAVDNLINILSTE